MTVKITVLCLLLSQLSAVITPGEGFQIKGTDAVAAAIWAVVAHWEGQPQDAIVAAVHYGGDTDTIACMAGALSLFSQQDELTVTVQATYHRRCTRGGTKPTLVGWMCLLIFPAWSAVANYLAYLHLHSPCLTAASPTAATCT